MILCKACKKPEDLALGEAFILCSDRCARCGKAPELDPSTSHDFVRTCTADHFEPSNPQERVP